MAYEPFVGYGTRKGVLYELDTDNLPKATTTAAYTGLEIYGIRSFALPPTNVRRIPHFDGDKVGLVQILPTLDVPSGTITVDGSDTALVAIVNHTKPSTVSDVEMVTYLNDQQGNEPAIGLLVYQAAKKKTGAVGWHVIFVPSTQAIPQNGQFGDNNYETTYQLAPSASPNQLFGKAFSLDDEGTETAGLVDGFSIYKPRVTAFLADGTTAVFTFDTALKPIVDTYQVFLRAAMGGALSEITTGFTATTTAITFDTGEEPADGDKLVVLHGVA